MMLERIRVILEDSSTNEAGQTRLLAMDSDSAKLTTAGLRVGAFGGQAFSADSLSEAIEQAGLERAVVGSLAIHFLFAISDAAKNGGIQVKPFFCESLGAAVASRVLAQARGWDHKLGFAMGLLHDSGRLALASLHGKDYLDLAGDSLILSEREAFGLDHTQAGLAVLIHRGFAPEICEAAAFHHGAIEKISTAARIAAAAFIIAASPHSRESRQKAIDWVGVSEETASLAGEESASAVEAATRLFR
jgi:HD-like signal output (HDOD) protein